jgi:hypothetical protein
MSETAMWICHGYDGSMSQTVVFSLGKNMEKS